jgi:hypothetical protein
MCIDRVRLFACHSLTRDRHVEKAKLTQKLDELTPSGGRS